MRFCPLLISLCLALPGIAIGENSAADRCAALYALTDADHTVESGFLVEASGDTPAYCRVKGTIDRTIRYEVSMPADGWTGRLLYHAPGGLAGVIGDTTSLLDEGFAMATTDTGHESDNDPSFYRDDQDKLNFAFRANHLTAQLSKRIIAEFYGRPVEYAYLWGCSNGGRAAMVEALRYPDDFDGIVAGAPAFDYGHGLLVWALEVARHQARHPLTPESVILLDEHSRRACDSLDGVEDGVIGEPQKCTLDRLKLDDLLCTGEATADCLTSGQIETASFFYTGITDDAGNVVVPGVYPGAETGDFPLWVSGPVPFLETNASDVTTAVIEAVMHRTPGFSLDSFDAVKDLPSLKEIMFSVDIPAPDFSRFQESGGKLIIYNGFHDFPCRAKSAEDFYAEALESNGADALQEYLRMYLVPGMVHCIGGPGAWAADYIEAIVDWVENDQAPDRIIAEHAGNISFMEGQALIAGETVNWGNAILEATEGREDRRPFTRPLCPYPSYAKYTGTGDTNDAANFDCVVN